MSVYPFTTLTDPSLEWRSLQDIQYFLAGATLTTQEGIDYLKNGDLNIPVRKVATKIYAYRPCLACDDLRTQTAYFFTTQKLEALLPQKPEPTSVLERITTAVTDCFWGCYFPFQCCWCTDSCKEQIVLGDANLGIKGVGAWHEHMRETGAQ